MRIKWLVIAAICVCLSCEKKQKIRKKRKITSQIATDSNPNSISEWSHVLPEIRVVLSGIVVESFISEEMINFRIALNAVEQ